MVIHINQQSKTQFSIGESGDDTSATTNTKRLIERRGNVNFGGVATKVGQGLTSVASSTIAQQASSVVGGALNSLNSSSAAVSTLSQYVGDLGEVGVSMVKNINAESFLRTVKRTTDSITLYMPDTLNFQYNQKYDELNLNAGMIAGAALAGTSIVDNIGSSGTQMGQTALPFLFSALGSLGGNIGRAFAYQTTGMVRNPMIELIYSQPQLRSFQFDFVFYPRDEKEALEVQNILEKMRFHQAPEIKSGMNGYFLIPPSEFDIKFYYMGKINPNIDPISSCVLESIQINYAPSGFTAYESLNESSPSLGRTGMPTAIQMTLMFKETQIMTKDNYRLPDRMVSLSGGRGSTVTVTTEDDISDPLGGP
jgi:hypothetical protein